MSNVNEVATKFEQTYESLAVPKGDTVGAAKEVAKQLNAYAGESSGPAKENLVKAYNKAVNASMKGYEEGEFHPYSRASVAKDGSIEIHPNQ